MNNTNNNTNKNNINNRKNTNKNKNNKKNNNYKNNTNNNMRINNKNKNNINDRNIKNKNNMNNMNNLTCLMLVHPGQALLGFGPQLSCLPYRPPHGSQSEREPNLSSIRAPTFRIHGTLSPSSKFAFMACLLLDILILLFKQSGQRHW